MEGHEAFRISSPALQDDDACVLTECPTGYVLRNAPYVYDVINVHNYVENGALNPLELSWWARKALSVIGSEKARLREMDQERRRTQSDSKASLRVLRRNHA